MGVFGSRLSCLSSWWPMTDEIQERITSLEQKYTLMEQTHTALDRKYSELDVNEELLQQQLRTAQSDIRQLLCRMDHLEHKITSVLHNEINDTDMVILRS